MPRSETNPKPKSAKPGASTKQADSSDVIRDEKERLKPSGGKKGGKQRSKPSN